MEAIKTDIHFFLGMVLSNKGKVSYSRKQQGLWLGSNSR